MTAPPPPSPPPSPPFFCQFRDIPAYRRTGVTVELDTHTSMHIPVRWETLCGNPAGSAFHQHPRPLAL